MIQTQIFAGAICEGISCAPLYVVLILRYGFFFIIGGIFIIFGIRNILRAKAKHIPFWKSALLCIVGVLFLAVTPILQVTSILSANNKEKEKLAYISFPIYEFSVEVKTTSRIISDFHKPESFLQGQNPSYNYNNPNYAHVVESYALKDNEIKIFQFETSKYPGSSSECTPVDPEFPDRGMSGYECTEIGKTNLNTPIYASLSAFDESYIALYTTISDTRITIKPFNNKPALNNTLLEILQDIKPIDKADFKIKI